MNMGVSFPLTYSDERIIITHALPILNFRKSGFLEKIRDILISVNLNFL